MLAAIQMPTWLVDFWAVYGDIIMPVLVTLVTAIITKIAIDLRTNAKINAQKAELQIKALEEVAKRENNKPQLEEQSSKLAELEKVITYLSDMISMGFQNANIDPEIKENLKSLANKIKYGTEDDLVKQLEAEKIKLNEQLEALKEELNTKNTILPENAVESKKTTKR